MGGEAGDRLSRAPHAARPGPAQSIASGSCSIYIISGGRASSGCERNHSGDPGTGTRRSAALLTKIIINHSPSCLALTALVNAVQSGDVSE